MDTEVADPKCLRRRVASWTAVMWGIVGITAVSLAVYIPAARDGKAALPPHVNVIIYILAATLTVLAYMARREARGELHDANSERRQAQREATRMAELVVIASSLRSLFEATTEAAKDANHRDGRLYGLMKFAHAAAIGAITERDLERDTEPLPLASGGGVYGVASVPAPANLTVLPSPGTVAAMRRLARKVTSVD